MSSSVVITLEHTTRATNTLATNLGTYTGNPRVSYSQTIGAATVTQLFIDERAVTGSEVLDLTSGLTDPFGEPLAFTNVQGIHVLNTGNGQLVFGGGLTPVFGTDQATVKAGREWLNVSTFLVSGTAKKLTVTGTSSYQILIYGS